MFLEKWIKVNVIKLVKHIIQKYILYIYVNYILMCIFLISNIGLRSMYLKTQSKKNL